MYIDIRGKNVEVLDIRQQIRDKNIDNFYIFTGDEVAVQKEYVLKLSEVGGCKIKRLDSISDVFNQRVTSLVKQRFCFVIVNDTDMLKNQKSWAFQKALGNNMLILQFSEIDKRSAFYKHFVDNIVDFQYLPEIILWKYLKRDTNLSKPYAKKLIEICENDYSRIRLEVDKVKRYAEVKQITEDEALRKLVENDVIYVPSKDVIFEFVDAVASGKITESFKLLNACRDSGEPTLIMVSNLYAQIRRLLQVQGCQSKDIEKTTGLKDWEIRKAKQFCGVYSNRELVKALKLIRQVEKGLKVGLITEDVSVDYLLINILGSWDNGGFNQ